MSAPTVVLVPGGFTGAWMWADVVGLLRDRRVAAVALDLPTMGPRAAHADFSADVRAVRGALDRLEPPVLLCGHSYGGGVITEAAAGPHRAVRHLVYLNAVVPDAGESLVSLMTAAVASETGERPDTGLDVGGDGLARLHREYARRVLFNDCGSARTEEALARLGPTNTAGCDSPLTGAAWRDLPATYLRGTEDRLVAAVSPAFLAHGPELVELPVGHCPHWSHPALVADLLADLLADWALPASRRACPQNSRPLDGARHEVEK
ncbi:alpha/beta fold hydrolase [Actinokineospora sp. 24-640]